jgi:glycosyltransferase involved in cell wall biosynthesis
MTVSAAPSRVAVIMPVSRARYLREALDSVFFQSLPPDEVIVIDDGSPDQEEIEQCSQPSSDESACCDRTIKAQAPRAMLAFARPRPSSSPCSMRTIDGSRIFSPNKLRS